MIVFRWLLPLLAAALALPALGAVAVTDTTPAGSVVAYRGSSTLKTDTGATARYGSVAACRAAIEADAEARRATASYRCVETTNLRVVWSANPPPPADSDGDGVPDASDACPTVAASTADGCPVVVPPPPPPPPPPTGDAYPLYPALNLAEIPWHTAAGAWGPQVRLQAPALPVTTRSVTVRSQSEFAAAAAVAGTAITIAQGWPTNTTVAITANDIDVTIPRGVVVGGIEIGAWPRSSAIARVRIRGEGRMGQYRDYDRVSDVVIDGVDMNGDSAFTGTGEGITPFRINATRVAVLNVRAVSAGPIWLGAAKHVVIANSNLYHGAASRAAVGWQEGWGIRNVGGPITIVDSRLEGTRYHNLRPQSATGQGELFYAARSVFVASAEARTIWIWNNLGQTSTFGNGSIFAGNDIYAYSAPGCTFTGPGIGAEHVTYSRLTDNRFFGGGQITFTQSYIDSATRQAQSTDNSFARWTQYPAWTGRGDPRQLPLPGGLQYANGEGACTGF